MKYLKYFEDSISYSNSNLNTLYGLYISNNVDGDFDCYNNKLTSLEYGPKSVRGSFNCSKNKLTSLEFGPEYVGGDFICNHNKLTSLEFIPEKINSDFYCFDNHLTSLEFGPKYIIGDFNCYDNKLTSLEYGPEYVGGNFHCFNNDWTNPIPYELIKKHNIYPDHIYSDEQVAKFGSYKYQKEFLTINPEKYKDLEHIGFDNLIKEEFDWLFNASDMGLM